MASYEYDIFLSHNSNERDFVHSLAQRIERESWRGKRLRVFLDEWDIRPGQSIPRQLEEALPQSRKVVVVLSPDAVKSGWVELERFVTLSDDPTARHERLIPILRRDCKIPPLIGHIRQIDFRDDARFDERFVELLAVLRDEPLPRGKPSSPTIRRPPRAGRVPPLLDERDAVLVGNPFYCAGMIRPPFEFIGRRSELRLIIERAGQGLSSTAIFGERRLGKSSLLYESARRLNVTALPLGRYRAVYLDCQHPGCRTEADLLASVGMSLLADQQFSDTDSGRWLASRRQALETGVGIDLGELGEVLSALRQDGVRPVILFDELEQLIADRDVFDDSFFDHLRAFGNRGDLGIVTSTKPPLLELFTKDRPVSNFPGLFVSRKLGHLTDDEAQELVAVESSHTFGAAEQALALGVAGKHPLRLQVACAEIYRMLADGLDVNEASLRGRYDEVVASWGDEVTQS